MTPPAALSPAAVNGLTIAFIAVFSAVAAGLVVYAVIGSQRVERLADLTRYAPGDERVPVDCVWCVSLTGEGLTIADCNCRRACDYPCTWCKRRRTVVREGRRR